jgi:type III secretion system FlhB-like substrate exporter
MYRYAREKLGYDLVPSDHQTELGQKFWNKIHEDGDSKLAWRIRFRRFKDLSPLMPERENKIYLMPTDHSALRTFGNLTGKDDEKITKMPTEAYLVSGDARVGDMSIINAIHRELQTTKDQDRIEKLKKLYLNTSIPYSQYRPGIFKYPEILAEPNQLTKLDKSVTYNKNTGEIDIKDKIK